MKIWDFYIANHTSKLASKSKLAFVRFIFFTLESSIVTSDTSFCVNILGCFLQYYYRKYHLIVLVDIYWHLQII